MFQMWRSSLCKCLHQTFVMELTITIIFPCTIYYKSIICTFISIILSKVSRSFFSLKLCSSAFFECLTNVISFKGRIVLQGHNNNYLHRYPEDDCGQIDDSDSKELSSVDALKSLERR
jgi:hypothetical protein